MKRKDYQEPATKVVKLQHRAHLLAGSNKDTVSATMESTFVEEDI